MPKIQLRECAVVRSGDKGNVLNVAVVPINVADYDSLLHQITAERVRDAFEHLKPTAVRRFLVPSFHAMNFLVEGVLDGGVSRSRFLDGHGKSLSWLVAQLDVDIPQPIRKLAK